MPTTLFLFDTCGEGELFFFELQGDYSRLDGSYINSSKCSRKNERELTSIVFDDEGEYIVTKLRAPTRDWKWFVTVGILP